MGLGFMVNDRMRMHVEMGGLDDARMHVEVDPFDAMVSMMLSIKVDSDEFPMKN